MTGWLTTLALTTSAMAGGSGYLRFPDVHGDKVVFTAEEDLWIAPLAGGAAVRLTRHDGGESHATFSPDGRTIAFTASYDGNSEVYLIDAQGGEPRRLTWHPDADEAIGWTPDGKVLFRSGRENSQGDWELYTVAATGGDPSRVPLGWAARLAIDPKSGTWAFNRISNETRTWKRYRGGTSQDLWVGNPARADFARVTDFDGTDSFPMWHDGRIFFASDKGGTFNLWSMKPDGSDRKRHTEHSTWDVRWPGMGPDGKIAYMLAGDIRVFDPADGSDKAIDITLPSDRRQARERYPDHRATLTWASIAPQGDRILYNTRGDLFSIPVEDGVTLPITRDSGSRESWGSFSPDGTRVVYVTDVGGEESIVTADAWGRGQEVVVKPAGAVGWHFPPSWSPDGKWIAWSDHTQRLYLAPSAGGAAPREIDRALQSEIRDYRWSPDGRYLAWSSMDRRDMSSVFVYDTQTSTKHRITGPTTDDWGPAWDPQGRYLYFVSSRHVSPVIGARDFEYVLTDTNKLFAVLLRPDVEDPFAPLAGRPPVKAADEEGKSRKEKRKEEKKRKLGVADEEGKVAVVVDFTGIGDRITRVPVPAGSYANLAATPDRLFFLSFPGGGMVGDPDLEEGPGVSLLAFDIAKEKLTVFRQKVNDYELARDAKSMMIFNPGGDIAVVDAWAEGGEDEPVDLSGVVVEVDPVAEWRQIFLEGWRHMRDFYWDEGMAGIDWVAMRDRYASLLPRLASRSDLRDVMGELIGELATSHTYVWGGDPGPNAGTWTSMGLLGADLVREGSAYKVERIYRGDPNDTVASPLRAPGVGVDEGDYILAVNHQPWPADLPWTAALIGLGGRDVLLTVNDSPKEKGARDVVVRTVGWEGELRYVDWVRRNREYVAEKSGGKLGYIHIPDMGANGLIQFERWFYNQLDKEGMVVDARWNGGGFVSQLILERLRRKVVSFDRSRGGGIFTYPARVLNGPFVVLTNEFAGSDGDIFPASVQAEKLAPIIGMRSWGGVIGIRNDKRMVDGGSLTQPEYAFWWPNSGWGIENHGVDPDIVVPNLPQELARGVDAQLDRGIAEAMRLHAANPPLVPRFGPAPDKSRKAFEGE